jgi:hypothetical protein
MSVPLCVVCKICLDNPEKYVFNCPKCHRQYILDYEVMSYEEKIGTAYDDEQATIETGGLAEATGPRLETIPNELDFPSLDEEKEAQSRQGKIPIPKYLQNSDTTQVIDYKEELN